MRKNIIWLILILTIISCKDIKKQQKENINEIDTITNSSIQKVVGVENLLEFDFDDYIDLEGLGRLDAVDVKGDFSFGYFFDKGYINFLILFATDKNNKFVNVYLAEKDGSSGIPIWNDQVKITEDEYEIYFLKDYTSVSDIDGDGDIDIIMTCRTRSYESISIDRVVLLIKHKSSIIKIINEGGEFDDEKKTVIDKGFYKLPKSIRGKVYTFMESINDNTMGIDSKVLKEIGTGL